MPNLTDEQTEILRLPIRRGLSYAIKAFAGTGKTFILRQLANKCLRTLPGTKFLYLAFNKAIQLEANGSFPRNVEARTINSVAYGKTGREYGHKLGNLRPSMVSMAGGIPDRELYRDKWLKIRVAITTLTNWLQSADKKITDKHAPAHCVNMSSDGSLTASLAAEMANRLWDKCMDLDSELPMPHDGYLKLFELSDPKFKCDVILVDEAQDLNPVTLSILNKQRACKFLVGDPHQQIYGFRGSINAFEMMKTDAELRLSHSFRFGPEIAEVATTILGDYKNERVPVVGDAGPGAILDIPAGAGAILFRSNAALFMKANECAREGEAFNITGGLDHDNFRELWDVFYLYADDKPKIRDPFIRSQSGYSDLIKYADDSGDRITQMTCGLISRLGSKFPGAWLDIQRSLNKDAPLILSTAHKAKGLEFENVEIWGDFLLMSKKDIDDGELYRDHIKPEEVNLLYVAATRAMKGLYIDHELNQHLNIIKNGGFYE